jgi:hypothetical protein
MFDKTTGTKGQGNVGVAAAILYFAKQGCTVSVPLNDSQDYDLVVDLNNELKKVQVKTTKYKSEYGVYQVSVKSAGGTNGGIYGRVCDGSADLLYVLCQDSTQYLIPREFFKDKRNHISLGQLVEKFKVY